MYIIRVVNLRQATQIEQRLAGILPGLVKQEASRQKVGDVG